MKLSPLQTAALAFYALPADERPAGRPATATIKSLTARGLIENVMHSRTSGTTVLTEAGLRLTDCQVCHEPRSTDDHALCDRAAGQFRASERVAAVVARAERVMPATYAEPRKGTNAHTAWSRGFTFAEWRALPRSERMAETLRADGKVVTEEQVANLRKLDTPAGALAALRATR